MVGEASTSKLKRALRDRGRTKITLSSLLIFLAAALLISLASCSSVSATEQRVFDMAGLLNNEEVLRLEESINRLKEELLIDIVIVTTDDAAGKTSRAFADDYYDDHGFGLGSEYDGLLLLINMDHREVYISTAGLAIDYFTDARLDSILDALVPYLADASYFATCNTFLDYVSRYVQAGVPEGQYRVDESELSFSGRLRRSLSNSLSYLLIGMVISTLVVGIMASRNRGMIKTSTTTYLNENSVDIISRRDRLINTSVSKTKINTSSGSGKSSSRGSRSTTHRSRSGRTRGGRGRSF